MILFAKCGFGIYSVMSYKTGKSSQSLNRDIIKMTFHSKIYLPILLFLLRSQTVQADDEHKNPPISSFSEMISNIMALINTELVVISDYNSKIKVI